MFGKYLLRIAFGATAVLLASCGGGGGGASTPPISTPSSNAPAPPASGAPASGAPSPGSSASPHASPSASAGPQTTPTPAATTTPAPSTGSSETPASTFMASTWSEIGTMQILDRYTSDSTIRANATQYDGVWGSFDSSAWYAGNPNAVISLYFMPMEDLNRASGHDLAWFQSNHPDWILYACQSDGTPTHDLAWSTDGFPDVPLDFHNPNVINYEVTQVLRPFALANHYNALASDNTVFTDFEWGGNPNFGQTANRTEYACGVWNANGTFTTRYTGRNDPAWASDIINWFRTAKPLLAPYGIHLIAAHEPQINNPDEATFEQYVDGVEDETGFTSYDRYRNGQAASLIKQTVPEMVFAQRRGVAFWLTSYFCEDGKKADGSACTSTLAPSEIEYAIATYELGNEGGAYLFASPTTGDYEFPLPEYHTKLGVPCAEYFGGPSVYERKFTSGLVVVNASGTTQSVPLPALTYSDMENRPVTNPLSVAPYDAYVLKTSGSGCS